MIRRFWRSTFGLVAFVAFGLVLVTSGIGVLAYRVTHEALEKQLDHRIEAETAALLAEVHAKGFDDLVAAIGRREAARSVASMDYLLLDASGRQVAGAMAAESRITPGYEEFFSYRRGEHFGVAQALTTRVTGGTLVVAADRAGLNEIDRTLVTLFTGALIAMMLVGVGAAALIGALTRRRLSQIDATAMAIIEGDLGRRIPRDGSDSELDRLSATLNRMLDRITDLMDNLRQVSSDVAHDLRTPLTRLHNRLDRALVKTDENERVGEIEAARGEAAELLEIFASLLRIAEVEGMAERLPRIPVDLSSLVEQMVETYRPDMEVSGHTIGSSITPNLMVAGDRRLLNQAIANVLDNVIRHTPAGTNVNVAVTQEGQAVQIIIADDGPGADDGAERLFQRFARSEKARSTPGHGLGLSLVRAIMHAHGGSAKIERAPGFSLILLVPAAF